MGLVILKSLLINSWNLSVISCLKNLRWIFQGLRVGICRSLQGQRSLLTAGGLDGWAWNEIKALPLPWFSGLAVLLELVQTSGGWPQGLLDAYIAMIPKADGASVFSLGNGLSSVDVWFSTALEIEEVLSGIGGDQLHVMVADVVKSFDTVDRSNLDCALCRPGLPGWFRRAYFSFRSQVRFRFKLAAGLGEPWCMDGGIPQGCSLSMVFIVAL